MAKGDLISRAMRELAKRRSPEQAKETASAGGRAYWEKLTPEQRSAENKRRAAKRKKRAKDKT